MAAQVKLNQLIAIEKGAKAQSLDLTSKAYRDAQSASRLTGISRVYTAKDEDGDQLPSESTLVQVKAESLLTDFAKAFTREFDVTLTKDTANTVAKADVVVDGTVVLAEVPVTYLLFLEKKLNEVAVFVRKLPVLDPDSQWSKDEATGVYATPPAETVRTKKVPKNWVKAPATDKHPAQVEVYHEDVIVGTWSTRKFSGALPADKVAELVVRVDKLRDAVKMAREAANSIAVADVKSGDAVFGYLFG